MYIYICVWRSTRRNRPADNPSAHPRLAFTRYCFTSNLYCGSQSSFHCPPPPAKPTLLQYFCTTTEQYTPPYRPFLFMPYIIPYWRWQYRVKVRCRTCCCGLTRRVETVRPATHQRIPAWPFRRIHKGYFRDDFPTVISALGYLWGGGKKQFYLRVKSFPGDNPKPPSGPILDPTPRYCFTSKRLCTNQSFLYCPLISTLPALLQCVCKSIAQCTALPRRPICMPCTIP